MNPVAGRELLLGTAGEHLVCADLLAAGFRAFLSNQSCPYDVAVEVEGRLIRVQVKTTQAPRAYAQKGQRHVTGYIWGLRRGKGTQRRYGSHEMDVVALVALDTRQIAYLPITDLPQGFQMPVSGARQSKRRFSDYPFEKALDALRVL